MNHIIEYVEDARARAQALSHRMPIHQALVYAVEHIVERALPLHRYGIAESRRFIEQVCEVEDIETPAVLVAEYISNNCQATANATEYRIALKGKQTHLTLLHELAHLIAKGAGHTEPWRTVFVRLVRTHISVEHAGLLHSLYARLDLASDWLA